MSFFYKLHSSGPQKKKQHSSVQEMVKIYPVRNITNNIELVLLSHRDERRKKITLLVHVMSVLINKSQRSKIPIIKLLNMINMYQLGE